MKITLKWLKDNNACSEGVEWFENQKESDLEKVINSLMEENHFDWANWTLVRFLDRKQKIQYAVFAAEQVIDIFEKRYPDDKRPHKAIEAARECLKEDTEENRKACASAAYTAAYDAAAASDAAAAYTASAASAAAAASADAAYAAYTASAAAASADAAYAAYTASAAACLAAAASAAAYAAYAAYDAAAAYVREKIQITILKYGMGLLKENERKK